jgi:hypothetical protein
MLIYREQNKGHAESLPEPPPESLWTTEKTARLLEDLQTIAQGETSAPCGRDILLI